MWALGLLSCLALIVGDASNALKTPKLKAGTEARNNKYDASHSDFP